MRLTIICTMCLGLLLSVGLVSAQTEEAETRIGEDIFLAGGDVVHSETGVDDLFMAGSDLLVTAPISGTAHIAGREVTLRAAVGGDVYAAGENVNIRAAVEGDVTAAGYRVDISAPVSGDVRAAGSKVTVSAPVAGYVALAGDTVTLNDHVTGDAALSAATLEFGEGARVGGTVTVYTDSPDSVSVPATVAPAERVEIREIEQWTEDGNYIVKKPSLLTLVGGFFGGIAVVSILAILLVAVASGPIARLRERALAKPVRAIWFGFLAMSVLSGAAIITAVSLWGIFVTPVVIVAAVLLGLIGYVIGAYVFGVGIWGVIGKSMSPAFLDKVIAAVIGATAVALLSLVPFVGWLITLGFVFFGAGAITVSMLRPQFFATPAD